ncbi:MobV family relaxase [Hymenobacter nivis]|nr:MobV family relaxase [Hymenobacter nivis]
MPQVIIRVAKIKTQSAAQGKTKHNYRLMNTPNADPELTTALNQELVNTSQRDYWTLANERIAEGIAKTARGKPRKVRDDQVHAVEVVLTASPDWFKRGEGGQAEDVRGSKWVTDNLDFLKNRYGAKNVVSFTLHQDETTPHIHAVVIPLTEKGRLSADTLFNRTSLTQLQTDYAKAMATHGLERGVKGSRRQHLDMKQMYGRQDKATAELKELATPVTTTLAREVELGKVPAFGIGADAWRANEQKRVNAELVRQVQEANKRTEQANKRIQEAAQAAIANAGFREEAEALKRQLNVSEGLKNAHYKELTELKKEVTKLAVNLANGKDIPRSILQLGTELREGDRLDTKKKFEAHLVSGTYEDGKSYYKGLEKQGFRFRNPTEDNPNQVRHPKHGFEFIYSEVRPNDRKISEQVEEQLQARRAFREQLLAEEKQAEARKIEQARQKVATHELSLMDQAFGIYKWKIGPGDLAACLVVPKEKVDNVLVTLRVGSSSWAADLRIQGVPNRTDELVAVYVKYDADFAPQVSRYFDKVRAGGSQVYEHATHQSQREQWQALPRQKSQEREQEPTKSKDFGIGG